MAYLPITLGIGQTPRGVQPETDKKTLNEVKQSVFDRDDYTCACCGFRSQKYQDVLFKNGNQTDTKTENMVTTCIFCNQCFNLDAVSEMRSGLLIWLPEIEQYQLHHLARAIYVARISQGPMAEAARRSLDVLMGRREEAKERLGTDDPRILSLVLKDYISSKSYEGRKAKLEGIRLFPLDRRIISESDLEFNQFPQILAFWRSKNGPFAGKLPKDWVNLYSEIGLESKAA